MLLFFKEAYHCGLIKIVLLLLAGGATYLASSVCVFARCAPNHAELTLGHNSGRRVWSFSTDAVYRTVAPVHASAVPSVTMDHRREKTAIAAYLNTCPLNIC